MPGPVESVGLSAETAQLISGGAFAVGARAYLRWGIGWRQNFLAACLTLGGSYLFGAYVRQVAKALLGADLPLTVAGPLAGLACIGVSDAILRAVDKLDIWAWLPGRKPT